MKRTTTMNLIEAMEKRLTRVTMLSKVLESLEGSNRWNMPIVRDEKGDYIEDEESGEYLRKEPTEDDYCYEAYLAYKEVIEVVEKYIQKVAEGKA